MLILKSFFRKKKNKIFTFILSILTIAVILIFSIIKYSEKSINEELNRTSIILIISENDYYYELKTYQDFTEINRITLLRPDYDCEALKANTFEGIDEETGLEGIRYLNLTWQDFLMKPILEEVVIYPNRERPNVKLENNQIAFSTNNNMKKDHIIKLIGEKITLLDGNNNKHEFLVSNHYETNLLEMTISDDMFDKIIQGNDSYVYNLIINNHDNLLPIEMKFRQKNDVKIISHLFGTEPNNYINLVYSLSHISYVIIVFLLIILLIIIIDIIKDEKKTITLERLLGYNIKKIKKNTRIKILSMTLLVGTISIFSSTIIIILLNQFLHIDISAFDYKLLFRILFVFLLVSAILSYILQLKNTKYIKKNTF